MSDPSWQVDFAIGLVDSVLHLPNGKIGFCENFLKEILIHVRDLMFFGVSEDDLQVHIILLSKPVEW